MTYALLMESTPSKGSSWSDTVSLQRLVFATLSRLHFRHFAMYRTLVLFGAVSSALPFFARLQVSARALLLDGRFDGNGKRFGIHGFHLIALFYVRDLFRIFDNEVYYVALGTLQRDGFGFGVNCDHVGDDCDLSP